MAETSHSPAPVPPGSQQPAKERDGFVEIRLRPLHPRQVITWLVLGWRDFRQAPAISLFYGACFVAMGWILLTVYEAAPAQVLALSAAFLLAGPFLCMGLYYVSEQLERGEVPRFTASLLAFTRRLDTIAIFGLVMLVLGLLWGRASLIVVALSFDGEPDLKGSILRLLEPQNLDFVFVWVAVGSVFAALIYSMCVVSIPMILDRRTDAITATLTSMRLVVTQPWVMFIWGALITGLVVIAMLPWFVGLLVVGPVLGHASWHAYRAAVG